MARSSRLSAGVKSAFFLRVDVEHVNDPGACLKVVYGPHTAALSHTGSHPWRLPNSTRPGDHGMSIGPLRNALLKPCDFRLRQQAFRSTGERRRSDGGSHSSLLCVNAGWQKRHVSDIGVKTPFASIGRIFDTASTLPGAWKSATNAITRCSSGFFTPHSHFHLDSGSEPVENRHEVVHSESVVRPWRSRALIISVARMA
jgi:hypothetical protein